MGESHGVEDEHMDSEESTQLIASIADVEPLRTPTEWAEVLGHMRRGDSRMPQSVTHADWQHAAADKLYGWANHAYNFQSEPFLLSQADYERALAAAARFPLAAPHAPALTPLQAKRFEGFEPRVSRR